MTHDGPTPFDDRTVDWWTLHDLHQEAHDLLYVQGDAAKARALVAPIEEIIRPIPSDSWALRYWESAAIVAELKGELDDAIRCRRRKIELTLLLHQSVKDGKGGGPELLEGRDVDVIEERRGILADLESRRAKENPDKHGP